MQIEIFLAALMFYESCGKAAAIEGSEHATDTCIYVHTPPTVVGELVSAMADECGQPDRSMMHSRLISRCNFLFPALLRISPCLRQLPANPHPAQPPCATGPVPNAGRRLWRHGLIAPCPVRPWSKLAMPMCQRFSWPLFGARPDEWGGEQKSLTKTQKNESFRKNNATNFKGSRLKTF